MGQADDACASCELCVDLVNDDVELFLIPDNRVPGGVSSLDDVALVIADKNDDVIAIVVLNTEAMDIVNYILVPPGLRQSHSCQERQKYDLHFAMSSDAAVG
ncbi:hypothetical protein MQA28_26215, partial [Escherichia coli]|nr:hypothetical protein [Escherichia coli]